MSEPEVAFTDEVSRTIKRALDVCLRLMSDLNHSARELVKLYDKRMQIEEFFRDGKSKRDGWSLRDTALTRPDPPDRPVPRPGPLALGEPGTQRRLTLPTRTMGQEQPSQRVRH